LLRVRLPSGSVLGHYLVGDLIGKGGMGEVYEAKDTRLDRSVALDVFVRVPREDLDVLRVPLHGFQSIQGRLFEHVSSKRDVDPVFVLGALPRRRDSRCAHRKGNQGSGTRV
jgi:hypothetical protein